MADINETQQQPKESVYQSIMEVVIETESMAAAKKRIEEFGKGFDNVTKALGDLGISSGKVVNTFKGFGESVVGINELTQAIKNARNEQERLNAERDLSVAKTGLLKKGMEALSDVFKFNIKTLNDANQSWEEFRKANLMTASELNEVAGSFERAGAAALMSSEESSKVAMNFKQQGLVLNESNKELIETTGKIATVFNVDLGRAAGFVARQYQYLGITGDKLEYGMGRMSTTMRVLGVTGEEGLKTFEALGSSISLIFGRGDKQGFAFTESMFRLTGVMKGMGLTSNGVANQIQGVMKAENDSIRANVLIASQMGMSYDQLMKQMIDSPEQYAASQQKAFEKMIAGQNEYTIGGMKAIKKYADMMGIDEERMMKTLQMRRAGGKTLAQEMEEASAKAKAEQDEYEKSGRDKLDKAFQDQMSSWQTGWAAIKKAFNTLWASSLRPILGKFLGMAGELMGKFATFVSGLSGSKLATTIGVIAASVTTLAGAIGYLLKPLMNFNSVAKKLTEGIFSPGKTLSGLMSKGKAILGGAGAAKEAEEAAYWASQGVATVGKATKTGGIMGKMTSVFSKVTSIFNKINFGSMLKSGGKLGGILKFLPKLLGKALVFIEPILMLFDFFTTKGSFADKIGMVMAGSKKGGLGGAVSGSLRWATIGALIGSIFPGPGTIIGGIIGAVGGALTGGLGGEKMGGIFKKYGMKMLLASILGLLTGGIGAPIGWWLGGFLEGESGKNMMGNLGDFFKGFLGPIKEVFGQLGKTFKELWGGLKSIWDVLSMVFDEFFEALGELLGGGGSGAAGGGIKRNKEGFTQLGRFFGILLTIMNPLITIFKVLTTALMGLTMIFMGVALAIASLPIIGDKKKAREIEKKMSSMGNSVKDLWSSGTSPKAPPEPASETPPSVAGSPSKQAGTSGEGGAINKESGSMPPSKAPKINKGNMTEDDIKKMIIRHEGIVLHPYLDSLGLPTIGVGHLIKKGESFPSTITQQQAIDLFNQDYASHAAAAAQFPGFNSYSSSQQGALIDLAYNMGPSWYKKWPTFVKNMTGGDYNAAASNLLNSRYAKQVKGRANEVAGLIAAAEGAVVTGPTMTIMGERETELITPLSKVESIMTSVIQKAISTTGKTALPTAGPLMGIINSLITLQKQQLEVQKNILNAINKQGPAAGGNPTHNGKSMEDVSIMRWSLPPLG